MPTIEKERDEHQEAPAPESERSPMPYLVLAGALAAAAISAVLGVIWLSKDNGSSKPAAAASSSKPSSAAPSVPARRIGVTLKEFTLTPTPNVGRAGKVTFSVRNSGNLKHEFVVVRTTKPAAGLLKGSEADESGNVGEVGDVQPGEAKSLSLRLKRGHYALICNLPGHYQSGQHADFTVK